MAPRGHRQPRSGHQPSLNNLARLLRAQGELAAARPLFDVQSGVVAQGFPAPAVRFTADADNALGAPSW